MLTILYGLGYQFVVGWWGLNLSVFVAVLAVQTCALSVGLVTLLAARRFGLRLVTNRLLIDVYGSRRGILRR